MADAIAAIQARRGEPFVFLFAVFLLACFVGYYVVWNVTPALHIAADGGHQRDLLRHRGRRHLAAGSADAAGARIFGFLAVIARLR